MDSQLVLMECLDILKLKDKRNWADLSKEKHRVGGNENTCEEEDIEFLQEDILWSWPVQLGRCFLFGISFLWPDEE